MDVDTGLGLKAIREPKVSRSKTFSRPRESPPSIWKLLRRAVFICCGAVYARTFIKAYARFLDIDPNRFWNVTTRIFGRCTPPPRRSGPESTGKPRNPLLQTASFDEDCHLLLALIMALSFSISFHEDSGILQTFAQTRKKSPRQPPHPPLLNLSRPTANGAVPKKLRRRQRGQALSFINQRLRQNLVADTGDRKRPQERLLSKGDTLEYVASDSFMLDIGNAGGVEISFQENPWANSVKRGKSCIPLP